MRLAGWACEGRAVQSDFLELNLRGEQVIVEIPDLEYQARVFTEVSLNPCQGETPDGASVDEIERQTREHKSDADNPHQPAQEFHQTKHCQTRAIALSSRELPALLTAGPEQHDA